MPRALRITLWSLGILATLVGGAVLWVESQLRPEPLGLRVRELLATAKIQGGITRIEASVDGTFSAEGIDLTLEDGTKFKAASLKGDAGILASAFGSYTLESFEAKGVEIDLSQTKSAAKAATPGVKSEDKPGRLPVFSLGPYSVSGRVTLADGKLVRFSVQGDEFNSAGHADFRAGLGWPGFAIGTQQTDPRGEILLKAEFQRPLGGAGLTIEELTRDIGRCELHVIAKDASPLAAGSMELNLEARQDSSDNGLVLGGNVRDSGNRDALQIKGSLAKGLLNLTATLDVDPTRFGILSRSLPDCRITGTVTASTKGDEWKGSTNLKASWTDLSRFAPSLPKGSRSEWTLQTDAHGNAREFTVGLINLSGHGVTISIPQPLTWKGKLLPEESAGTSLLIQAQDADLVALAPFLSFAGVVATEGRWTGAAEISLVNGEPVVKSTRTHEFKGLTIAQLIPSATAPTKPTEKILVKDITILLPLKSENGVIALSPLSITSAVGDILSGDVTFHPGKDGSWQAKASLNIGVAELAGQPGWEDLPLDKLRGIRVNASASVNAEAGKSPVVALGEAQILRSGTKLLSLKLRQPYPVGTKPSGVLVEANASDLPLESLAALVPGLKLTGNLNRADIVVGFRSEGLFVRTEGAPMAFVDTSVSWAGKLWVRECDLAASLDLLIGDKATVLGFNKAEFKNKGRVLAAGDLSLGFGDAATTLKLTGDLAALAEQPFAGPLGLVTNGTYVASAQRSPAGDIDVGLDVSDVAIRNSAGHIKQAQVRGKYSPTKDGLKASGEFRLTAVNLTEGNFTLTQTVRSDKTDWQANVRVPSIDVDDLLALAPKSAEEPVASTKAPAAKPDKEPLWKNQSGKLQLNIGKAVAYAVVAETVSLTVDADEQSVRLTRLDGKLAEGTISGKGSLSFKPTISNGPYVLDVDLALTQFEIGAIAAGFPAVRDYAQGKATATAHVGSLAGTVEQLAANLSAEATLTSKGGRLRAFGDKNSSASLAANTAGNVGEIAGGLAVLGGLLAKNKQGEKVAKIGAAVSAAAKLQKSLSDFTYDSVDINVARLASGSIKLHKAEIRNAQLLIGAKGGISVRPELAFADWPLDIDAQIRGAGEYADFFNTLGFSSGKPAADGLTDGPTVKVSGSLNEIKTDLKEKLSGAVDKVKSSLSNAIAPEPATTSTPAGGKATPTPTKKKGLFGELDKILGQ